MKWSTQEHLFKLTMDEMARILTTKGKEYAGDDDALGNFKSPDITDRLGLTPMQAWGVYYHKHHQSILHYIKHEEEVSEELVEGRIHDAMNYLFLLLCLVVEKKKDEQLARDRVDITKRNDPRVIAANSKNSMAGKRFA